MRVKGIKVLVLLRRKKEVIILDLIKTRMHNKILREATKRIELNALIPTQWGKTEIRETRLIWEKTWEK